MSCEILISLALLVPALPLTLKALGSLYLLWLAWQLARRGAMQDDKPVSDVLTTPGHLISLAARLFARLSEARLKPLGFGVGHLPVLAALQERRVGSSSPCWAG